jgi:hypothetical protein
MMDFAALRTQAIELLQREGRAAYRVLKLQIQIDDDLLEVLKDDLIYAKRLAVDEEGKILVWAGAPAAAKPDTRPPAEAERQLYTMLLAVMALLPREKRVTYRTLQYVFGVDEACLYAVRDELRFRQLAREEGGQGLVWTGVDPPPVATAAVPGPTSDTAMSLSAVSPRPPLPPPEGPRPLLGPTPALDEVSSLLVDDVGPLTSDDVPVIPPVVARSAPDAERRQLTALFCDLVGST